MKIGFLDRTQANWTAGASYTRSMVNALSVARDGDCELLVLSGRKSSFEQLPPGVGAARIDSDTPSILEIRDAVAAHGLDLLLPVTEALLPETACALVGWVPDFQHCHLPEYFNDEELRMRDRYFGYLIDNCDAMMFSSKAVLADFRSLYPGFKGQSACAHFSSGFAYEEDIAEGDPRFVIGKYGLPDGFVLVANQFWKHKNHRLVVEAVALARRANPSVHVVMVGVPSDSRDPRNTHLTELFQRLSVEKLFPSISVLGEVPFADLVALMRCALEVVQPSRFEGWNTTVEDALALGKRVACSDLATHREQATDAFFFPQDDAGPLADHFASMDWSQCAWAGSGVEQAALQAERERGRAWAAGLIDFCRVVIDARRKSGGQRAGWRDYDPATEVTRHPQLHVTHLEVANESLKKRVDSLSASLQAAKDKAAEDRKNLREKVRAANEKNENLTQELWSERARPLRARVGDELRRLFGGRSRSGRR
jgi:glycosyltransferase involved in cell wall biosynthesis